MYKIEQNFLSSTSKFDESVQLRAMLLAGQHPISVTRLGDFFTNLATFGSLTFWLNLITFRGGIGAFQLN